MRVRKKTTVICVRIPTDMLIDIDEIVDEQRVITRNTWILIMLQDKLSQMKSTQYRETIC